MPELELDEVVPIITVIAPFNSAYFSGGSVKAVWGSNGYMNGFVLLEIVVHNWMVSHIELLWCNLKNLGDICVCCVEVDVVVNFSLR